MDTGNSWGEAKIDTFKGYEEEPNSDSDAEEQDLVFGDMQLFLHSIGLPEHIEKFRKHNVTLGQLLEFDENDLINCGIDLVGDRKKILSNTGQMHAEKWSPSSLHDLTAKTLLSSPGIYIALNDMNKHIEYIGVSFRYLKKRLRDQPDMLELGKDYVGVSKIATEIEDLVKTSKATYVQLKALNREVCNHLDDPNMKPANQIDKSYIRKLKLRQAVISMPSLIVTVALFVTFRVAMRYR